VGFLNSDSFVPVLGSRCCLKLSLFRVNFGREEIRAFVQFRGLRRNWR